MSYRPWGHYVAVTDPPAERQDGTYKGTGLYLPENTGLDVTATGIVLGVGPAVEAPDGFEVGASVYYSHGHALELGVDAAIKFIPDHALIAWEPALDHDKVRA